jgi:hypothetical protein
MDDSGSQPTCRVVVHKAKRTHFEFMEIKSIGRLVEGIIVIVLGALMLAEGVVSYIAGVPPFFAGTNPAFVVAVGIIALIVGSSLIEKVEK